MKNKTAILGTAHKLREGSAAVNVRNIFRGRNNITSNTNCKYRTAAALCTVLYNINTVCFLCIIVNIVHTGDDKDNNNNNNNNNNNVGLKIFAITILGCLSLLNHSFLSV
jgi:hypothetical protein